MSAIYPAYFEVPCRRILGSTKLHIKAKAKFRKGDRVWLDRIGEGSFPMEVTEVIAKGGKFSYRLKDTKGQVYDNGTAVEQDILDFC